MTTTNTSAWSIVFAGVGTTFKVLSAEVTLDDRNSVYCAATVTLAAVSEAVLATVNPQTTYNLRATLTADQTSSVLGHQVRTFDLYVHRRTVNDDETVTFELASDELILELRGRVATTPRDYYVATPSQQKARKLVNDVLVDHIGVGTALQAGALDLAIPRLRPRTNLLLNPSFEVNTADWSIGANVSAFTSATAGTATSGTKTGRMVAAGAGTATVRSDPKPISAGQYALGVFAIGSSVSRQAECAIVFYSDEAGTVGISNLLGGQIATSTVFLSFISVEGYAPANAKSMRLYVFTYGNAATNVHLIDTACLEVVDPELIDSGVYSFYLRDAPFDGTYNPDPTMYSVAWSGTAHASSSTLTPLIDRGFYLTFMMPGQTAAAFLRPAVQATGGRLFCDEARLWRLVDNTYTVAGTITAQEAVNLTDAGDVIDLSGSEDGVPITFTGVVIEYVWTGPDGLTRTKRDVAGVGTGRVFFLRLNSPFPGLGAAAAMLSRAAGRGRTKPFSALADYLATPGKALALTHRGTNYTGRLSRVRFNWSDGDDTDRMEITPRELV